VAGGKSRPPCLDYGAAGSTPQIRRDLMADRDTELMLVMPVTPDMSAHIEVRLRH
jgi:hypothetical protein